MGVNATSKNDLPKRTDPAVSFFDNPRAFNWTMIALACITALFVCIFVPRCARRVECLDQRWQSTHATQIQDAKSTKHGDVAVFKGKGGACFVLASDTRGIIMCSPLVGVSGPEQIISI